MEELLLDQEDHKTNLKLASKGQRFATYILDAIVLYFIQQLAYYVFGLEAQERYMNTDEMWPYLWKVQAVGMTLFFFYYLIMESMGGKTIGKYLLRLKVVTEKGNKPTTAQIIGRTFTRIIPIEAFSFLGSKPTGWHDRWSKTLVIKENQKSI